jgi:hypothetical protein
MEKVRQRERERERKIVYYNDNLQGHDRNLISFGNMGN